MELLELARLGDLEGVKRLIQRGVHVNTTNHCKTALYVACEMGHTEVARYLLDSGASVDLGAKPLIAAAKNDQYDCVKLLLEHNGVGTVGTVGEPYYDDNSELVELPSKHPANIDVTDVNGNTALHRAIENYYQRTTSSGYSDNVKSVIDILLKNKCDVNIVNSYGETPLYIAVSRKLLDVVSKMLQDYEANPNKGSPKKSPLTSACLSRNVELVDMLLKHGADPNPGSEHPLFIAVDISNTDIITSLLSAGASVNAMNHEKMNVVCFAAKKITSENYYPMEPTTLSTMRLLLQHGANFNMQQLPDGRSPLHLATPVLAQRRGHQHKTCVVELLQLMVKHGAMLQDSGPQPDDQSSNSILETLATFDGSHEFIVDLFRAGAGFQLIASCCSAVATTPPEAKSIRLCQAAVLAGYTSSRPNEELHHLQLAADSESVADGLLKQLVSWLNEDRQRVPSLFRQCRVAIRRHLSTAVHYQTILPAIDKLPLPNDLKLYLQFDGKQTEIDLGVNQQMQTTEETLAVRPIPLPNIFEQ